MKYLELPLVKTHLNVEQDFTEDDTYIMSLIDVAEEKVAKELCVTVEDLATIDGGGVIPYPLKHAMLLSIGSYYANREEVTAIQTRPLEQGVKYLTSLYRKYNL